MQNTSSNCDHTFTTKSNCLPKETLKRLERLSGTFPVLAGESIEDFEELLSGLFYAIKPRDVIEEIEVTTMANALWEARRVSILQSEAHMSRVKSEIRQRFAANLPPAIHRKLTKALSDGSDESLKNLLTILQKLKVNIADLLGVAYQVIDPRLDQIRRLGERSRAGGRSSVSFIDRRRSQQIKLKRDQLNLDALTMREAERALARLEPKAAPARRKPIPGLVPQGYSPEWQ